MKTFIKLLNFSKDHHSIEFSRAILFQQAAKLVPRLPIMKVLIEKLPTPFSSLEPLDPLSPDEWARGPRGSGDTGFDWLVRNNKI